MKDYTCWYSEVSKAAQQMTTGTKAVSAAGASVAVGISLLNLSSPVAIWAMANQFQLFMLLMLTQSHLPSDVVAYITGNRFMSFSMDFIPLENAPVIDLPLEWLSLDQSMDELEEMGILSGSSFNNNVCFMFTIF